MVSAFHVFHKEAWVQIGRACTQAADDYKASKEAHWVPPDPNSTEIAAAA
jgi:hypothetical protein